MKILFIQGGSRCKQDNDNNWYTDTNFNINVWNRYKSYCNELTVILRKEQKAYEKEYANKHFNRFPQNIELVTVDDLYKPHNNFFDLNLRKKTKKLIREQIEKSDFIIIRSIVNFYTLTATKICRKLHKKYLIEVTGVAFDGLWNYGNIYGKLLAIPMELTKKRYLKNTPYALYVTENILQKRYPCRGKILGCSDVEIDMVTDTIKEKRKKRIDNINNNKKIILGTLASLELKTKRQEDVIKALGRLKKIGKMNFEYQLVGGGNKEYLYNIAKQEGVENQVVFLGLKPHDEVFDWLDTIDVYIQPSCQEGLCRAIVEAMSRGCPIVCSDVGGNPELASEENIFRRKKVNQIVEILKRIDNKFLEKESKKSFKRVEKYEKNELDKKRDNFYKKCIESSLQNCKKECL